MTDTTVPTDLLVDDVVVQRLVNGRRDDRASMPERRAAVRILTARGLPLTTVATVMAMSVETVTRCRDHTDR